MSTIILALPPEVYTRMREMIIAGGKYPATGENGIHAASQLLLFLDQQIQEQQKATPASEGKPNGTTKPELAEGATRT